MSNKTNTVLDSIFGGKKTTTPVTIEPAQPNAKPKGNGLNDIFAKATKPEIKPVEKVVAPEIEKTEFAPISLVNYMLLRFKEKIQFADMMENQAVYMEGLNENLSLSLSIPSRMFYVHNSQTKQTGQVDFNTMFSNLFPGEHPAEGVVKHNAKLREVYNKKYNPGDLTEDDVFPITGGESVKTALVVPTVPTEAKPEPKKRNRRSRAEIEAEQLKETAKEIDKPKAERKVEVALTKDVVENGDDASWQTLTSTTEETTKDKQLPLESLGEQEKALLDITPGTEATVEGQSEGSIESIALELSTVIVKLLKHFAKSR